MADYLSSYTGQEIDQKLGEVDKKINITDIVDDPNTGEADSPASSRLVAEAYKQIESIKDFNANKVLVIDKGDQTVNGKKTFAALLTMNGGATIPTGKALTITDKAANEGDAVNLAMLKDHGLSIDDSFAPGIVLSRLNTGYLKIAIDIATMTDIATTEALAYVPVGTASSTGKISYNDFVTRLTTTDAFNSKVDKTVYESKMSSLDNAIAARVLISSYNNDIAAINSALNNRVLTSTYNAKMSSLDSSIAGKVDTTTYNTAIAALQTGKVDVTTYNNDMAGKVGYAQDGQVSVNSSSSAPVFTLPKANCLHILVSTALTDGITDVFEIFMNNTSVISVTNKVKNTSGTVPASFTASVSGNNVILTCANASASTSLTVRYKILANF